MEVVALVVALVAGGAGALATWYGRKPYHAQRGDESRSAFVNERRLLGTRRAELTKLAIQYYPSHQSVNFPGMLSNSQWVPAVPFRLELLRLSYDTSGFSEDPSSRFASQTKKTLLPKNTSGEPFATYSEALESLARPNLFNNLACYRLKRAELSSNPPAISVGLTNFFDGINETESIAHELARAYLKYGIKTLNSLKAKDLPLRQLFSDPFDTKGRIAIFSVSALTIKLGADPTFLLHARDSAKVAMAGSSLHLTPSGVFQPTAQDPSTIERDLSLWLTLCREYAEEFLGTPEASGEDGVALSYFEDEPYASINIAYSLEKIRVFVLGMGTDPLTLCPEVVTASIIDGDTYDEIFEDIQTENDEGRMRGERMLGGKIVGYPFTEKGVSELLLRTDLSPATRAGLETAWRNRDQLLP